MDYELSELLDFCLNIFEEKKHTKDMCTLEKKYAEKLYSRILDCCYSILALSNSEEKYVKRTSIPVLFRIIIEATIDLNNLNLSPGYETVMKFYSKKEEVDFLKHNYGTYNNLLSDINSIKKSKQTKIEKSFKKLENELKNDKYWKKTIWSNSGKNVNSFVYVKIKLTKEHLKNKDRHKKYITMYDICSAHSHNNISFLSAKGLKNISSYSKNINQFKELMVSILKNGLLNYIDIIDCNLTKEELDELKLLKSNCKL